MTDGTKPYTIVIIVFKKHFYIWKTYSLERTKHRYVQQPVLTEAPLPWKAAERANRSSTMFNVFGRESYDGRHKTL
jgi:hypothetical protein